MTIGEPARRRAAALPMAGPVVSGALFVCAFVTAAQVSAQLRAPSVGCQVADTNVALDLFLPLARDGSGNAARGMRGTLEIHHQKLPRERRTWTLDDRLPAQFWNVAGELRIRLLLGQGEQLVDVVIEARQSPAGPHTGTFRLETGEGVKVVGRVACTVG